MPADRHGAPVQLLIEPEALRPLVELVVREFLARLDRAQTEQPARSLGDRHPLGDGRLLLTARQAAEALSVSERTLYDLTAPRGEIPAVRIGGRRNLRYAVEDLRAWIDRQRQP